MDHHWLITWTCYGTWLPGDAHGFVSKHPDGKGNSVIHNIPGTVDGVDVPHLEKYARKEMTGPPVNLTKTDTLIRQYQETARIRRWHPQAASVMYNHTHVVVSVHGDPDPNLILETLKSWATRALKKRRELPANGTFWTAKGSKRKLPDEAALPDAVIYVVKKQWNPLAICYEAEWKGGLDGHVCSQDSHEKCSESAAAAETRPLTGLGSPSF